MTTPEYLTFCACVDVIHSLGGAKGSVFYTKRYAAASGLNSVNLDFLPVRNVEESPDVAIGGVMAAVPVGKSIPVSRDATLVFMPKAGG